MNILILTGLIIGLGAVTVIDTLGFLGRKSSYWTLTTLRAHQVTKPLIWLGLSLYSTGLLISNPTNLQLILLTTIILNGIFLSFYVSPTLLKRMKQGKESELLPLSLQVKITISFFISIIGWWGSVIVLV